MKKLLILSLIFFVSGCSVYETFVNITRLQFKLGRANNFELNGIDVTNKNKLSDFNFQDVLNISSMVSSGKLPVSFVLNVEAKNPNDGTGGYRKPMLSSNLFLGDYSSMITKQYPAILKSRFLFQVPVK